MPAAPSLRRQLARAFAVTGVVPVLLTAVLLTERQAAQRRAAGEARLAETALAVCRATDAYVDRHLTAVRVIAGSLAAELQGAPSAALTARLAHFHALSDGFSTVLAARADGRIVGASPATTPPGGDPVADARSVADRPYFQAPMRTGSAFVSDAFLGRGFGHDPLVAVSAPVRAADGRTLGVVEGSFDVRRLGRFGHAFADGGGTTFLVLDRAGRVIHASAADGPAPLTPLAGAPVVRALAGRRVATLGRGADAVVAARCTTERGWQVIVQRPMAAVARAVRELYALALFVAVLVGAAALVWARALAWRIARPLATLAAAVRAVAPGAPPAAEPGEAGGGERAVNDPGIAGIASIAGIAGTDPRAPLEVRTLAAHLACMESRVGAADAALRAAVAAREGEIAARTRQLAEANDALARLASTDPLTGLLNRRGFDAIAERELATAHATGTPCLLLYGDLDLFKQINDTHGHATGDTALVAFADVLRETFRVSDVVARLGGDEFAVLVYGAAASEEPRVRERLDAALAALNATGPHPFTLAATFGAAPCEAARPRTLHALLREADTALYRGKRQRRAQRAA